MVSMFSRLSAELTAATSACRFQSCFCYSSSSYFTLRSLSCSRRLRFAVFSIRTSISLQLTDNGAAAQPGFPQFSCRLYGVFGTYPYFPQAARQHSQLRSPCFSLSIL